jgi:DNA replication protein DnaC
MQREERRLNAAHVPERYRDCSLDAYEIYHGADKSLSTALLSARKFVDAYPVDTAGKGLLFTGSIGVGKTHLAVGVLQRLVRERGVKGLFCDYRELLKSIQNSYNPQVQTTELDLLRPIFSAEVLVLDDLGAQKPNEWVWDTVALILNSRYNDKLTTIITTNYADQPAGKGAKNDSERAAREPSLGDRIGDRMLSANHLRHLRWGSGFAYSAPEKRRGRRVNAGRCTLQFPVSYFLKSYRTQVFCFAKKPL